MNLFVTISFTLLVILASLFYLAKVKTENYGSFFKWSGYLVFLAACGLLGVLMFKGVKRMMRHDRMQHKEMRMKHGDKQMKKKSRSAPMDNCSDMQKMDCGMEMDGMCCCNCCGEMGMDEKMHGHMDGCQVRHESTIDTIDGKIIRKETEIIEKKK